MPVLELLGIAKVGRVLALVTVVGAAAGGGGFWAGSEWTKGRAAITEVVDLRADAEVLREQAEQIRRNAHAAAQDLRTSARRMDAIVLAHQESRDALDTLFRRQRVAFDSQLDRAEAADLLACRIGDFGMRVWAAAAEGRDLDPAGAAGADPGVADAAVPGEPAHAAERQRQGGAGDVDGGGTDLPPLQPEQGRPRGGGAGL